MLTAASHAEHISLENKSFKDCVIVHYKKIKIKPNFRDLSSRFNLVYSKWFDAQTSTKTQKKQVTLYMYSIHSVVVLVL